MDTGEKKPSEQAGEEPKKDIGEIVGDLLVGDLLVGDLQRQGHRLGSFRCRDCGQTCKEGGSKNRSGESHSQGREECQEVDRRVQGRQGEE